jgi:diketogulonate reductase-like aldo/keto reductase
VESTIPYRTLGRTGERVSAIGLGGWHLGLARVDEPLSVRIIRTAIDRGINFLDNCWDYNDGASETRMGKGAPGWLPTEGLSDDEDRRAVIRRGDPIRFFRPARDDHETD